MTNRFQLQVDTPASTGPTVDYNALNKHVVETVEAQETDARIMIISGIVDLGYQKQEDAKMEWKGTDEQRAEIEAKAARGESKEYFEVVPHGQNDIPTLCKRWPVKDQREIAIFADDPTRLVNKGQFFGDGEGEALPYRMMLNNEFYNKDMGGKIPGRALSLREGRNDDGSWSFAPNSMLHKLGAACGALVNGKMKPEYLGNCIGKAVLCNVTVNVTKSGDKEFLNEKIGFTGPVPSIMKSMVPKLDDKFLFMVNMKGQNDLDAVKNIRVSCLNIIKRASNFAESDLRKQLIEVGKIKEDEGNLSGAPQTAAPSGPVSRQPDRKVEQTQAPAVDFDAFDDDIPFAPIGLQEGRNFLHMI